MNIYFIIFMLIALIIIIALVGYLFSLLRKIKANNLLIEQAKYDRFANIKNSILIIAKAIQTGQCNSSEGVVRINALFNVLGLSLGQYPNLYQHYSNISHMPFLEDRDYTSKKELKRMDKVRIQSEFNLEQKIQQDVELLIANIEKIDPKEFVCQK